METDSQLETSWIRQIAAGDRGAFFEKLYFAYQKRLFGYPYRLAGDAAAAEELTNEVMFEVWKNAGRFRADSKLSTWIFGIAHHRVLNHWRRPRPETVEADQAAAMADRTGGPEQAVLRKDAPTACSWRPGPTATPGSRQLRELPFGIGDYQRRRPHRDWHGQRGAGPGGNRVYVVQIWDCPKPAPADNGNGNNKGGGGHAPNRNKEKVTYTLDPHPELDRNGKPRK